MLKTYKPTDNSNLSIETTDPQHLYTPIKILNNS